MKRLLFLLFILTSSLAISQTSTSKTIEQKAKEFAVELGKSTPEQRSQKMQDFIYSSKMNNEQKGQFMAYLLKYIPKDKPIVKSESQIKKEADLRTAEIQQDCIDEFNEELSDDSFNPTPTSIEIILVQSDHEYSVMQSKIARDKILPYIKMKDSLILLYKALPDLIEQTKYGTVSKVDNPHKSLTRSHIAHYLEKIKEVNDNYNYTKGYDDNLKCNFVALVTYPPKDELDAIDNPNGKKVYFFKRSMYDTVKCDRNRPFNELDYYDLFRVFPDVRQ